MIHIAMVGCGRISQVHAEAAKSFADLKITTCCDVNEDHAKRWSETYGCSSYYTDLKEMLIREKPEAVIIATWPTLHLEQIRTCLSFGVKNILCEKSLAMTGAEAYEIWKMVQEADAFLMEGFMFRHHPAIRKLEKILSDPDLGEVDHVRAVFSDFDPELPSSADESRVWRQRKECGGGVPYDYTCYTVNACNHFTGGIPIRVYATGGISEKYGTVNRIIGTIEYDNGKTGIIESSKKACSSMELQITCANGILNLPIAFRHFEGETIQQYRMKSWGYRLTDTYTIEKADSFAIQLRNFADVMLGRAKPILPLRQSVINVYTLEALVKSVLEERVVQIELPTMEVQSVD
ncbi:Gfo/Idh/MocA family protein [Paenibacillus sp. sgz302251]|uniref:Gfo/Idh/MocA family protein n=1 Tax=Paenibacillus sp. sgz302251 TaxID=3414493 RepID=UPI003C7D5EA4